MVHRMVGVLLYSALFIFLSLTCLGQETTGSIEGEVQDQKGAVVPNVSISITTATASASGTTTTGVGSGFRRTFTTTSEGAFRVTQVPPGTYNVVTEALAGFSSARYENVVVSIGKTTQLTIVLNVGGSSVTVDVAASDAPPVDATSSAVQTSINAEKMELLPKGTGFTSLLRAVPGTRPESRTAGFSVDGASGAENVFVIDGQEVTNYRTGTLNDSYSIPTQLVREIQVKSSGFDAEFGGATGGVISVVTKGGANEMHGEFGIQFETSKLNGNPRRLLTRFTTGSATVTPITFQQYTEYFQPDKAQTVNVFPTANLGGPIIKNRLWFFGSYSPQIFDTNVNALYYTDAPAALRTLVAVEPYRRHRRYEYAFGRIDANPFNSLRISSTVLWNPVIEQGSIPSTSFSNVPTTAIGFGNVPSANFGGTIGTLVGHQYTDKQGGRQTSNLFTLAGVYTPSSKLVFDAKYSRGYLNEKLGNYFVPEAVQVSGCANAPVSFGCTQTGANSITRKDLSIRNSAEFSVAYMFNAGGRHELKGGYQRFTIFNDVASGNTTNGSIIFSFGIPISSNAGGNVASTAGNIGSGRITRTGTFGHGKNLSQGIYIQDRYQIHKRLSLNLGVRFEQENLPSFNQFPSTVNFGWFDKVAPRVGFSYDPTGSGRSKIFASYGRFFDRVKFNLPRGSFGGEIQLDDYFEIFPGQTQANFNLATIVGGFTGTAVCPPTGTIAPGVLSRCEKDGRVPANSPNATIATNGGVVDPNLKPFRQTEFTVGFERQVRANYVFRTRYAFKNVDDAVEDVGNEGTGNEVYIIGNPGKGLVLDTLKAKGYLKVPTAQRRYDGLEFVFERRLAQNWYFNANYTYSRLFGNYTGTASSDEAHLLFGRQAPDTSRAFDLPFIGFTARGKPDNGRLPTDRPHVFNLYGGYIFDWSGSKTNATEISAFQTITSGTPMTTSIYGASTRTPQIFYGRGDLGRSPVYSQTDLNITHRYRFGTENRFTMAWDVTITNLFDQATLLAIYPTMNTTVGRVNFGTLGISAVDYANGYAAGTLLTAIETSINSRVDRIDNRYKMPQLYQDPRTIRFGFRLLF
jgi:hypothetical protein